MQDKKKKNIKVRDLKPKKDAKGGTRPISPGTPQGVGKRLRTAPRFNPTVRSFIIRSATFSVRDPQTKRATVPPFIVGRLGSEKRRRQRKSANKKTIQNKKEEIKWHRKK